MKYSKREIKFTILEILSKKKSQHKIKIIGRPNTSELGLIERNLETIFDPETRFTADQAFEELKTDGLIRPTYKDIVDPEHWVEITEQGRKSLEQKILDPLDFELFKLDPHLIDIRDGSWSALNSTSPDSLRQAAHSDRELISQVLRKAAPDAKVKDSPWFKANLEGKSPITRRHRLKYILNFHHGKISVNELKVIESACDLVIALNDDLQRASHADMPPRKEDVEDIIRNVEMALRKLLISKN